MKRPELLNRHNIATFMAIAVGTISLAGCGNDNETTSEIAKKRSVTVEYEFLNDGKRITHTSESDDDLEFQRTLSYCEGADLIDHTEILRGIGGNISRSPNHPACEDGIVGPEDFQKR